MNAIEIKELSKEYINHFTGKKTKALNGVSFSTPKGSIYGLLGPNGAGKTTLLKILLSISFPTMGEVRIFNQEASNYISRKNIGFLPENHKYPQFMKGEEVLKYFGKLSGINGIELEKKLDEVLEIVKMKEWSKAKVKIYSKGMTQRLGLAQALINNPEIIFLDEPTDGVDPIGRKEIRDVLINLKENGKTVFLNSHLLSEVEIITDRVAILNKGFLIKEGRIDELTGKSAEYIIKHKGGDINFFLNEARNKWAVNVENESTLNIKTADLEDLNIFLDSLRKAGILIEQVIKNKVSLEDMFLTSIKESESREIK